MTFVDLEKTYENASRNKQWMMLEEYEVEGKLFTAIQELHDGGMACVKVGQR